MITVPPAITAHQPRLTPGTKPAREMTKALVNTSSAADARD